MTVIMKFGGAAVATAEHFHHIAKIVAEKKREFDRVVIVVSAMGNSTNELIQLARRVHPDPPRREYDMLVTVGERISISLLAMALELQGCEAVSFTGSQSGIITSGDHSDARIVDVQPMRLLPHLEAGRIAIVAGFQGVSRAREITTLGRGGSDTTAVALGIALQATQVEFYKDVPGIFTEDPKSDPLARHIPFLDYQRALGILQKGHPVLAPRCVALAERNGLPLIVRSFGKETQKTQISTDPKRSSPQYEGSQITKAYV